MYIVGYKIIIITREEVLAIFSVPVHHFFLGLAHLVIIGRRFELNTAPVVVLMIVHNHEIRLAFQVTLFPAGDSFITSVLQFTQASHNNSLWIEPAVIINYFTMQIGLIFNLQHRRFTPVEGVNVFMHPA